MNQTKLCAGLVGVLLAANALSATLDWKRPLVFTAAKPIVTVQLPGNRTTGFEWLLTSSPQGLKVISQKYVPYKVAAGVVGSGGNSIWRLRFKKSLQGPRLSHICWRYTRPWDPSGADKCLSVVYQP